MKSDCFSDTDRGEIKKAGLTESAVMEQIEAFERGSIPVRLERPCTLNDGIIIISEPERESPSFRSTKKKCRGEES